MYSDEVGSWLLADGALESFITERFAGIMPEWATEQAIEDSTGQSDYRPADGARDGLEEIDTFLHRCVMRLSERVLWFAGDSESAYGGFLYGLYRPPAGTNSSCSHVLSWEYCNSQTAELVSHSLAHFARHDNVDYNRIPDEANPPDDRDTQLIESWLSEHHIDSSSSSSTEHRPNKLHRVIEYDSANAEREAETSEQQELRNSVGVREWQRWFDSVVLEVVRSTSILAEWVDEPSSSTTSSHPPFLPDLRAGLDTDHKNDTDDSAESSP